MFFFLWHETPYFTSEKHVPVRSYTLSGHFSGSNVVFYERNYSKI